MSTNLAGRCGLVQRSHDDVIGGTAVGVDENDFAGVNAVHGDQFANEYFVRAVGIENLEFEGKRIADLRGWYAVVAVTVGYLHSYIGRIDDNFLGQGGRYVAVNTEINLVRDGLVGQVVLASDRQSQIRARHYRVMMLDNNVVQVTSKALLSDVALQIVVRHAQFKLQSALDILDTGVRRTLRVYLAVEELARLYSRYHVTRSTIDRHVVTGAQLVRRRFRYVQIGLLQNEGFYQFLFIIESKVSRIPSLH